MALTVDTNFMNNVGDAETEKHTDYKGKTIDHNPSARDGHVSNYHR